jgi:pimeloyl-ACP methyl ester carboxylesterase
MVAFYMGEHALERLAKAFIFSPARISAANMAPKIPAGLVHSTITTTDGARLSYYQLGQGPGLIILHGAIQYALSHIELAEALSSDYTVYLPSKRSRGHSDPYPKSMTSLKPLHEEIASNDGVFEPSKTEKASPGRIYNPKFTSAVLATEVNDLSTLINSTQAQYLIGVSSGALISLQTLLALSSTAVPSLKKVIIFEPPIIFSDHDTGANVKDGPRFEKEMAEGDIKAALVTAMNIVQLGPSWIPRPIMKALTGFMMWSDEQGRVSECSVIGEQGTAKDERGMKSGLGISTTGDMAPLIRYDFAVVEDMIGPSQRFAELGGPGKVQILLLGGSQSPKYLQRGLDILQKVIKTAERVEIAGEGHGVTCNADRRGNVGKAAPVLRSFFN